MFHLNRVYCRQSEVPRSLRNSSISEDSIGEGTLFVARFSQQPLAQQILVGLLAQHVARRILVQGLGVGQQGGVVLLHIALFCCI